MSTMIVEVYDALKEAGASEEKAKAAAVAIANYERYFVSIESALKDVKTDLKSTKSDIEAELKVIKAEITVLKWMLGFVIAGVISIFVKLLL